MSESKPTILFIDTTTPRPYGPSTVDLPGIGGTEQTIVTLAEGLAITGLFNVVVEQENRVESETAKASYVKLGVTSRANYVIVLRDPAKLIEARERFKNSKIYLYSHDLAGHNLGIHFHEKTFERSGCLANICVSQWHKTQTVEVLRKFGYTGEFRVKYIYNPISDNAINTKEIYDRNKLIWLASPHKGLTKAYELFRLLIKLNPNFKLYITNPGYLGDQSNDDDTIKNNVVSLGTIPHNDVLNHLRSSMCLFYPNTVFPETFGKIMAESNAVGTPVLTSSLGASREVLDSHPAQIIDFSNTTEVIKRVIEWREGSRPIVRGKPEFKLTRVIKEWINLLQ